MVTNLDVDSLTVAKVLADTTSAEIEAIPPLGSPDFQYEIVVSQAVWDLWGGDVGNMIRNNQDNILGACIAKMQEAGRYQGKQVDVDNAFYGTGSDTTDAINGTPTFTEL